MSQIVLITGATAGIGEAAARRFAREGWRLILTGRRADRLQALCARLPAPALPLVFDIRDRQAVRAALASLPPDWQEVEVLVNNAGLSLGLTPFFQDDPDDWDQMIDTNVKGLLYISREVAPGMVARGRGHIVNIASIAGKVVYPGGMAYCASKHAVDAISQGMRMDLLPYGVRVSNVAPGMVETEFSRVRFKGDEQRAAQVYEGMTPLSGEDIAEAIWWAVNAPPHVNVSDLLIMPTDQASAGQVRRR